MITYPVKRKMVSSRRVLLLISTKTNKIAVVIPRKTAKIKVSWHMERRMSERPAGYSSVNIGCGT